MRSRRKEERKGRDREGKSRVITGLTAVNTTAITVSLPAFSTFRILEVAKFD